MNEYFGYALAILVVLFYMFFFVELGKRLGRRLQNWFERMDQDE